jgi:hypothetical protein
MFNSGVRGRRAPDNFGTVSSQTQFVQQQSPQPSITGWSISGSDDTALDTAGGQTVLVNGTGFASGAAVTVNGQTISPVTVISPTQLSFTSIALAGGSYSLIVYNSTGGAAILVPGLIYSAVPTWTTSAGSIGTPYETTPISTSVVATSDSAITYSLSSGSLPVGATLYANGVITGTSPVEIGSTTYTFAIKAEDAELQDTTRTFTLTINTDVVTWSTPNDNATYTSNVNQVASNVVLNATSAAGYDIVYTANSLPTGLSLTGNTILGTPTVVANSSTLLTATANTTNRSATRTINWVVQLSNDPYFNLTTLLLNGETSSNYWIQDASTNKFALTVNGDTRPMAFSPYETVWSNFFDGTGDYLSASSNAIFNVSNADYTVECWVYQTARNATAGTVFTLRNADDTSFPDTCITSAGNLQCFQSGGAFGSASTGTVSLNTWTHVAFVRYSNVLYYYINGVASGSTSMTNTWTATTPKVGGQNWNSAFLFTGYISNLRFTKSAVYTTGFTPSSSNLTTLANTVLLTCQSNRFIDNSTNNFTITRNGDVSVSNFGPFTETDLVTGSGYFDGTGDYLTITAGGTSACAFGTEDFTIECWVYFNSVAATYQGIFDGRPSNGAYPTLIMNGAVISWYVNTAFQINGSTLTVNRWYHIAIARSGSATKLFVDGVQSGSTYSDTNNYSCTTNPFVGGLFDGYSLNGYISNFRILKGTALYTSTFTPPTLPLTAVANTSILILQNRFGENNNRFVDSSGINNFITRGGNTTQGNYSPFSQTGWSSSFNGSNDPVSLASTTALNIESVDFTIEAWIFMNVMPTGTSTTGWSGDWSQWFVIYERSAGGTTGWQFRVGATLLTLGGDGDSSIAWGTHGMTTNIWYHVAVSRASSTYRIFVNGTSLTLTTQGTSMGTSGTYYIGSEDTSGANFNGYISNLRVIKSQAIYTAGFTPSITPLSNYSVGSTGAGAAASITGTISLLTCNSANWVDNSPNMNVISRTGVNTRVQNFSPFSPAIITPTSYSSYFDGTGDYLTTSPNSNLAMGTGDFTIEFWFYLMSLPGTEYQILDTRPVGQNGVYPLIYFTSSTLRWYISSVDRITSSTLAANVWYHAAICRSTTSTKMFINGTQSGSTYTDSNNYLVNTFTLGATNAGNFSLNGYLSNFRILKGTALYTNNFTPPTSPLTAVSTTVILTCQSNRFIDNSTNNFTLTVNGNAKPTQFNPFGNTVDTSNTSWAAATVGGSMYFDGTGDNLTVPTAANIAFNPFYGFTVEGWVYFTSNPSFQFIVSSLQGTGSFSSWWYVGTTSGGNWRVAGGDAADTDTGVVAPIKVWHHFALSCSSSTARLFINGIQIWSKSVTQQNTNMNLLIGQYAVFGGYNLNGYLSNLRYINSQQLYATAFVPNTSPLSTIANTTLLLPGTNSGIIDYTSKNNLETIADTKLSATVTKFNNASIYFDGTGDYLTYVNSILTQFNTGNFTIECWSYLTSRANLYPAIFSNYNSFGSGSLALFAGHQSGATDRYQVASNGSFPAIQSATTISYNNWVHLAVVRNNNVLTLYINGVADGTTSVTTVSYTGVGTLWYIGTTGDSIASGCIQGYIDDFRITKGYARYTANFTPPTEAFITF